MTISNARMDLTVATRLRGKTAPAPFQRDDATVETDVLLETACDQLRGSPAQTVRAMFDLQFGLEQIKSGTSPQVWQSVIAQCQAHPVSQLLWQDPFTHHSYAKPKGYSGDAQLLDFLYGLTDVPAGTTSLGASVFGHMMRQQGALSVRSRGEILANLIDETAEQFDNPRILSIACGHLREGAHSSALMGGRVAEFVALDQDEDSLAEVDRAYKAKNVRTVNCSVRAILAGRVKLEGFHLVYAAGLYDYLAERVATRLTRMMFDMVVSGGRILVANFAPTLPEVGYMETFMDWKLIYRTAEEMSLLSNEVSGSEWKSRRLFWDEHENIIFLDMIKRSGKVAPNRFDAAGDPQKVVVPGLKNVTIAPAVTRASRSSRRGSPPSAH